MTLNVVTIVTEKDGMMDAAPLREQVSRLRPASKVTFAKYCYCAVCKSSISSITLCCPKRHDRRSYRDLLLFKPSDWQYIEPALTLEQGLSRQRTKSKRRTERRQASVKRAAGFHTTSDKQAIREEQQGRCYFCATELSIDLRPLYCWDHVVPLERGGTNWPSNLALTCVTCNKIKHNHSEAYFWRILERERGGIFVKKQKERAKGSIAFKDVLTRKRKAMGPRDKKVPVAFKF